MLVCNVSLRAPRLPIAADIIELIEAADDPTGHIAGIAVDIVEVVEAADASATGSLVFATLIDDPASVADHVDAYIGELVVEVAHAADAVDAGLIYIAAIVEELTAIAAQDGAVPTGYTDAIVETVTAAAVQDATVGAALVARDAMLKGVFVNSDGTPREANVNGIMVNV